MLIDRPTNEDLSMLDLVISKLEESMSRLGIAYFEYDKSDYDIEYVGLDEHSRQDPMYDDDDGENALRPRPIKRTSIRFNSKKQFGSRWSLDEDEIIDDGVYSASNIRVEWDNVTNIFNIKITLDDYEKDQHNPKRLRRSDSKSSDISFDFGFKNRREIIPMKMRLGKLYAKLIRDKKLEGERHTRRSFTDLATKAFPDLLDPLLLGGSLSEKRDDRRISSEGRKDTDDSSSGS